MVIRRHEAKADTGVPAALMAWNERINQPEAGTNWPDPEDWNLVCPKCGATPDSSCGWPTNCPTGLDKRSTAALQPSKEKP